MSAQRGIFADGESLRREPSVPTTGHPSTVFFHTTTTKVSVATPSTSGPGVRVGVSFRTGIPTRPQRPFPSRTWVISSFAETATVSERAGTLNVLQPVGPGKPPSERRRFLVFLFLRVKLECQYFSLRRTSCFLLLCTRIENFSSHRCSKE